MRLLVGLIVGMMLLFATMSTEGIRILALLNPSAGLLVSGVALGMTLLASGWQRIYAAYASVLKGEVIASDIFRSVGLNFLNAGLFGAFVGLIQILHEIHQPDRIGPALSMLLISLLYGFLGYLFFGLVFEAACVPSQDRENKIRGWQMIIPALILVFGLVSGMETSMGLVSMKKFASSTSFLTASVGVITLMTAVRRMGQAHFLYLANATFASGLIGVIVGIIHVVQALDTTHLIFSGLGYSLLSMLYAALICMIFISISGRSSESRKEGSGLTRPQSLMPQSAVAFCILVVSTSLVMYAIKV